MSDYIKRADAINAFWEDSDIRTAEVRATLKALPSADAVYGMWLPIEETLPTYDGGEKTWLTGMKCSNCGKMFDLRVGYYYCPTCGARMKNDVIESQNDVIEIVHCKDCKWYMLTDHNETEVCTNKQWDISMAVYPIISADDFCSYGEREK